MMEKSYKRNHGMSLIEIILAMALFSVLFVSLLRTEWGISSLVLNNKYTIASYNWSNKNLLNTLNSDQFILSFEVNLFGITHSLTESPFTKCQSTVSARSVWRSGLNSTSTIDVPVLKPDLDEAIKIGGDCGGQPNRFLEENFHEIWSQDLGFPITSVDIVGQEIFVGLKSAATDDPDIARVALDTGHVSNLLNTGRGVNKIDGMSDLLFVSQNSTTSQVVLVDGTRQNLTVMATSTLPNVAGQRPEGFSVYFYNSRIFVGTKRTAGHEFHVYELVDLPEWRGSLEANHNINDIEVQGDFAFLATSGNVRDLIVLNISDSSRIIQATTVDLLGNEDGKTVYVSGGLVFLGKYKALVPGHYELTVFKKEISGHSITLSLLASAQTGADVNDLVYANGFVYAATSHPQKEIQIFKLNSQHTALTLLASIDLPAIGTTIDLEDGKLVFAAGNKLYLYEQD